MGWRLPNVRPLQGRERLLLHLLMVPVGFERIGAGEYGVEGGFLAYQNPQIHTDLLRSTTWELELKLKVSEPKFTLFGQRGVLRRPDVEEDPTFS